MKKSAVFLITILLLLSLGLSAKTSKTKQLQDNLKQWEQFRWEGIIQVQSSAFSMRKNFVLAKNNEAIRIDVLDSGVLGLQAKPLAIIYIKDKIYLEAPTIKQLAGIDPNWFLPPGAVAGLINFTDSLLTKSQEITSKRKTDLPSASFAFDKKYRLTSVKSTDRNFDISITYNNRNQPSKLSVKRNGTQFVEFQINEQKYGKVTIEPLQIIPETVDLEQLGKELTLDETELGELNLDSLEMKDLNLDEVLDSLEAQGLLKGTDLSRDEIKQFLQELKIDVSKLKEMLKYLKTEDLDLYLD